MYKSTVTYEQDRFFPQKFKTSASKCCTIKSKSLDLRVAKLKMNKTRSGNFNEHHFLALVYVGSGSVALGRFYYVIGLSCMHRYFPQCEAMTGASFCCL